MFLLRNQIKQNRGPDKGNQANTPSFLTYIRFKRSNLWSHRFDEDVLWYGKGQSLGLQLRKYLHEEHNGQERGQVGAPKGRSAVSRCHCRFAAERSSPWVWALNEGSPQEARVIVGTAVEVLHRLWERQRRLDGCRNGSQRCQQPSSKPWGTQWISLRPLSCLEVSLATHPWVLAGKWLPYRSCPSRSPHKGEKGGIKAKIPVIVETKRRGGNLVVSVQAKKIWAHTVSLMHIRWYFGFRLRELPIKMSNSDMNKMLKPMSVMRWAPMNQWVSTWDAHGNSLGALKALMPGSHLESMT